MHVRGLVEGLDRRRKRTGVRSKNTNLTRAAGCPKSKWISRPLSWAWSQSNSYLWKRQV